MTVLRSEALDCEDRRWSGSPFSDACLVGLVGFLLALHRRHYVANLQSQFAMKQRANAVPLRQQVYLQLRSAIESGTFAAGSKLPPSREHAQALGVARNTVLWALERLRAEGYVVARVGDGSYVAHDLAALRAPGRAPGVPSPRRRRRAARRRTRRPSAPAACGPIPTRRSP
jgi:DNA-binding transcriptional regulator YhcF (GntR family)